MTIEVVTSDKERVLLDKGTFFNIYQPDGAGVIVAYIYEKQPMNSETLIAAYVQPVSVLKVIPNG
jgi:hypothetical protein